MQDVDPERRHEVDRALTDQLFRTALPMVAASLMTAGLVTGVVYLQTGSRWVLGWLVAAIVAGGLRVPLVHAFRRAGGRPVQRWLRGFTLQVAIYGLTWGVGAYGMLGHSLAVDYFVIAAVSSKLLGSLITTYAHPPAFLAFAVTISVPTFAYEISSGDPPIVAAGLVMGLFLLACVLAVRRIHGLLRQTIVARVEKEELARRVTEEKDLAIAAREEAQRATDAKTRFLAAASHDLRQPLQAQSLLVGALRARVGGDPELVGLVDRVALTGRSLRSLLDGLLDASRLDSGAVEPVIEVFALQPLLDACVDEMSVLAAQKGLALTAAPTSLRVRSDPAVVARILRNLVVNAIQHTAEGRVLIGARRGAPARLVVYDTGPGVPEAQRETIFEDFVQLDNPERDRAKGVGLGLGIVQRLARLIGARTGLDSALGRGSAFSITLEAVDATVAGALGAAEPEASVLELDDGLDRRRVLVIEDEAEIRDAMAVMLRGWGCEVTCAESGSDRRAREVEPDLILADHRLRAGETGNDAIAEVRRRCGRDVPALLVTGDTDPARVSEARSLGVEVLFKPVEPGALRAAIRRQLPG